MVTAESKLRLVGKNILEVDGVRRPIANGLVEEVRSGYFSMPFAFTDEFGAQAEGSAFELDPRQATNTYMITKSVLCQEVPLEGTGWFLGQSPAGEVVVHELKSMESVMVEYGLGWVATWIAGDERLRILSLTRPRFVGEIETVLNIGADQVNGTQISPEYWNQYRNLTQS